ncbi:MAG: 50S ribosomal protein L6 [Fidelibacterota bacterium]
MSRIGKLPVAIPSGVEVVINGNLLTVKGPKGELSSKFHKDMEIKIEDNQINVLRPSDSRHHKALHGLTRSLINNMVEGVVNGFEKRLEMQGIGYSAELKGKRLILQLGFSHKIVFNPPEGIILEIPESNKIVVKGIDKQLVGQVAAKIRSFKEPEPYKGKGIRYSGEYVKRKAGKAASSAK